jgi:hypothetical protein
MIGDGTASHPGLHAGPKLVNSSNVATQTNDVAANSDGSRQRRFRRHCFDGAGDDQPADGAARRHLVDRDRIVG